LPTDLGDAIPEVLSSGQWTKQALPIRNIILRAVVECESRKAAGEGVTSAELAQQTGLERDGIIREIFGLVEGGLLRGRALRGGDRVQSVTDVRITEHGRREFEQAG